MFKINIETRLYDASSIDFQFITAQANARLTNRKFKFNMLFQEITEAEFNNGNRESSLVLTMAMQGDVNPPFEGLFIHHGTFPSTAPHLKNDRYISLSDPTLHFLTVWSTKTNSYCELFVNDYEQRVCDRFIP